MPRALYRLVDRLLGLLFPERCVGCRATGALLCLRCRAALTPYTDALPALPPLAGAQVAFVFDGPLRGAVHRLKYRRQRRVAVLLGELLATRLDRQGLRADAIVAVPLHPIRQAERGFNQSALIAQALSARLGIPVLSGGLSRMRSTGSQVRLNSEQRRQNVAGAFVWTAAAPPPARLIIVDDVLTTGATLQACAIALQKAGAREIVAVAVARSRLSAA